MIIERRDILFDYAEVHKILAEDYHTYGVVVPGAFKTAQIKIIYDSDVMKSRPRSFDQVIGLLDDPHIPSEQLAFVMFQPQSLSEFAFFIPKQDMLDSFVRACLKKKIVLPRDCEKDIIVDDLMLGFRITIGSDKVDLQLED